MNGNGALSEMPALPPPPLRSRLGPRAHAQMVRAMEAARERLAGSARCAACPAAWMLGEGGQGLAVRCGVERSIITERGDPSTLAGFCTVGDGMAGYVQCPTWRAEKERIRSGRPPLVPEGEGV